MSIGANDKYLLTLNGRLISSNEWEGFEVSDAPEYGAHSNGDKIWISVPRDVKQRKLSLKGIFMGGDLYKQIKSMEGEISEDTTIQFQNVFDVNKEPFTLSFKIIVIQKIKYGTLSSKEGSREEMTCDVDIDVLEL